MSAVITDSMREWASAYVEACRYVAIHRGEPFDADKAQASIRTALLAGPRYDPRDEFEGPTEDWSDFGHGGADMLEASETRAREWRAR